MTFQAQEISAEDGQPVDLYQITIALGTSIRIQYNYCSVESPMTLGGIVYEPLSIERTEIEIEANGSALELILTMPTDSDVGDRLFAYTDADVSCEVFRTHLTDGASEKFLIFRGTHTLTELTDDGHKMRLKFISVLYRLAREIGQFKYSRTCGNFLYDERCGVDKNNPLYRFTGTISSMSGDDITVHGCSSAASAGVSATVPSLQNTAARWFTGGYVEVTDPYRMYRTIISRVGNVLTLDSALPEIALGKVVLVRAGCSLSATICYQKFDNLPQFSGAPAIPRVNVLRTIL